MAARLAAHRVAAKFVLRAVEAARFHVAVRGGEEERQRAILRRLHVRREAAEEGGDAARARGRIEKVRVSDPRMRAHRLHLALQACCDEAAVELKRKEHIRQLGLCVPHERRRAGQPAREAAHAVHRALVERLAVDARRACLVRHRRVVHGAATARRAREHVEKLAREQEVGQVVRLQLDIPAVDGEAARNAHDASIVQQHVEAIVPRAEVDSKGPHRGEGGKIQVRHLDVRLQPRLIAQRALDLGFGRGRL
mmetsp:Transcript_21471/g.66612  ORF Transcript_21471/g.66612 Transcript_21471/m.66612 type:complete len:252 (-) Transcript_21471:387-1142(-)